jgi:hypothetical protein
MNAQTLLQDAPSLRRTVVLAVLISVLLFNWQPDAELLGKAAPQRKDDRPLPEPGEPEPQLSHGRPAHAQERSRPLPGPRQAARRR